MNFTNNIIHLIDQYKKYRQKQKQDKQPLQYLKITEPDYRLKRVILHWLKYTNRYNDEKIDNKHLNLYLNDFIILYLINRDNIITNNQLTYTLNDTTYRINKKDGDIWLITKLPNDSFHINIFDIG